MDSKIHPRIFCYEDSCSSFNFKDLHRNNLFRNKGYNNDFIRPIIYGRKMRAVYIGRRGWNLEKAGENLLRRNGTTLFSARLTNVEYSPTRCKIGRIPRVNIKEKANKEAEEGVQTDEGA